MGCYYSIYDYIEKTPFLIITGKSIFTKNKSTGAEAKLFKRKAMLNLVVDFTVFEK